MEAKKPVRRYKRSFKKSYKKRRYPMYKPVASGYDGGLKVKIHTNMPFTFGNG